MNKLTTELKSLHDATIKNLKSSKAKNTLRAYNSDFKDFKEFCVKHGFNYLPSEPKIISLYLTHLSKFTKISTIKRRIVSITTVHKLKGLYLDTKESCNNREFNGYKTIKRKYSKWKKTYFKNSPKINNQHNQ